MKKTYFYKSILLERYIPVHYDFDEFSNINVKKKISQTLRFTLGEHFKQVSLQLGFEKLEHYIKHKTQAFTIELVSFENRAWARY